MDDIVPELYKKIKSEFDGLVSSDEEIQAILNGDKVGTFAELYPMSKRVGQYAAKSLSNHYTEELLPDGILYWNIMERTIMPIMKNVHKIDNQLAFHVQKKLDVAQKIGIKPQESDFPEDRVNSVMNMLSTLTQDDKTDLQRASQVLTRSIVNVSNSIIDNFIQKNAEFRGEAGLREKIIRISSGHCCEWCDKVAGTYKYPDVPKDVYRRHDNCDCTVEYVDEKIRQNVWTKKKIEINYKNSDDFRLSASSSSGKIGKREDLGFVDYSKAKDAIDYFSDQIRNFKEENAIIIQKDGKVIRFVGTHDSVVLSGIDLDGAYVTHNHPISNGIISFGEDDFVFFRDNSNIKMLVCCNRDYTYYLEKRKDFSNVTYNQLLQKAIETMDYSKEFQDHVMEVFANEGYVRYEKRKT